MAELMSDGVHEGTFRYEYGTAELDPEDSYQADIGIELEKTHVSLIVNAFSNYVSDFIYTDKLNASTGGDSLVEEDGILYPAYKYFQADSYLYGGELVVDFHPHPIHWLHFENSLDLVYAQNTNGDNLPFIPPPQFQSELKAEFAEAGVIFRNLLFEAGIAYHFKQNRVMEDFETPTPAYFLINARIGCEIKSKKGQNLFQVMVIGDNLANVAFQDHLSRLKYAPQNPMSGRQGIFNMGRNFIIKIIIPLEIKI
jgi:iron complex outermembrane receptor protein